MLYLHGCDVAWLTPIKFNKHYDNDMIFFYHIILQLKHNMWHSYSTWYVPWPIDFCLFNTSLKLIRVKCLLCIGLLKGVHQRLHASMKIQFFVRKKNPSKSSRGSSVVSELEVAKETPLTSHTHTHTPHIVKQYHVVVDALCLLSLPRL